MRDIVSPSQMNEQAVKFRREEMEVLWREQENRTSLTSCNSAAAPKRGTSGFLKGDALLPRQ
jgi:hypothetical protein